MERAKRESPIASLIYQGKGCANEKIGLEDVHRDILNFETKKIFDEKNLKQEEGVEDSH